jgi:ribosome-binding factor A
VRAEKAMQQGYKRSQRVAGLLKREISRIIHEELKDPSVGEMTITEVTVSDDLRIAKIYISSLEEEDQRDKTLQGLQRAASFIRSQLGLSTSLRYLPELRFFYDSGAAHAEKIEQILRKLQDEE